MKCFSSEINELNILSGDSGVVSRKMKDFELLKGQWKARMLTCSDGCSVRAVGTLRQAQSDNFDKLRVTISTSSE